MSDQSTQTTEFTRKEVNVAAARLAKNLRRFMDESDQFVSLLRRYDLTSAAITLEEMADGK
jgi:hypothetical protein